MQADSYPKSFYSFCLAFASSHTTLFTRLKISNQFYDFSLPAVVKLMWGTSCG